MTQRWVKQCLPIADLFMVETEIVVPLRRLDAIVFGHVGLNNYVTARLATARSPSDLRQ